eukprot:162017-Rhodomonas_salina.1
MTPRQIEAVISASCPCQPDVSQVCRGPRSGLRGTKLRSVGDLASACRDPARYPEFELGVDIPRYHGASGAGPLLVWRQGAGSGVQGSDQELGSRYLDEVAGSRRDFAPRPFLLHDLTPESKARHPAFQYKPSQESSRFHSTPTHPKAVPDFSWRMRRSLLDIAQ